jgi:hypothetical protein
VQDGAGGFWGGVRKVSNDRRRVWRRRAGGGQAGDADAGGSEGDVRDNRSLVQVAVHIAVLWVLRGMWAAAEVQMRSGVLSCVLGRMYVDKQFAAAKVLQGKNKNTGQEPHRPGGCCRVLTAQVGGTRRTSPCAAPQSPAPAVARWPAASRAPPSAKATPRSARPPPPRPGCGRRPRRRLKRWCGRRQQRGWARCRRAGCVWPSRFRPVSARAAAGVTQESGRVSN